MTVLVGVDPAHRSAAVVQLGEMLARSLGLPLLVAAITPRNWAPSARPVDTEWLQYADDAADVVLDHARTELTGDVPAEFVRHEASSARRGLLDLVEKHTAKLIVLGSSTAGPIGQVTVGAEADALLHASPVPVAIAPRGYRAAKGSRISRITAAYSGSESSDDLVIAAAGLAASGKGALRLAAFAVMRPVPITAGAGTDAEDPVREQWIRQMRAHADRLLHEVSELPSTPASVDTVVGTGDTWRTAIGDVHWEADDVLIIGSSSLGPLARVFVGSHAAKVVRHSPVPVVVVPRGRTEILAARAELG
jgi:nucleotide-binding universal stress UspA family protein